ncbi:uncharacterized protein MELLADRAFT_59945 [Melampsora larici-populina 98AG31]|uniref:Uncharacterized protein n=1 Tax=Melampsora larici-populina (strain 98AG31 / pathotype 3-4-7) TaxID=747676 RepID=F4R9D4_MELLP|nr:uncharacterized protein MELLADRAFT_59945 [Melampsora larici-populina 98AG31]EGG11175.1 hypothetical protein MELLADRAFT_59945 [Melampsora larici-populina 98AG31]
MNPHNNFQQNFENVNEQAGSQFRADLSSLDPLLFGTQASTFGITPNQPAMSGSGPFPDTFVQPSIHTLLREAVKKYLADKRAVEVKSSHALFNVIKTHAAAADPDSVNQILNDLRKLLQDNPSQLQSTQPAYNAPAENTVKVSKKRKLNTIGEQSTTGSQTSETATAKEPKSKRSGFKRKPAPDGNIKRGRPRRTELAREAAEKAAAAASQSHDPQAGPSNQPAD